MEEEKLSIKSIKHILNNLFWSRTVYEAAKSFWDSMGAENPPKLDFDLIEAFQTIFNKCENYLLLCKVANVFNKYVEATPDIWYYDSYSDDDKMETTYNLKLNVPDEIKNKVIKLANKINQEIDFENENY